MASSLLGIPLISDLNLKNKNVFIRVDFNVPVVDGEITDDSRIAGAVETINYAVSQGAKVVLGSHFGRPKGKHDAKYSLELVAKRLQQLTELEVLLVEEPQSEASVELLKTLRPNQIILLENLRFDPSETSNGKELVEAIFKYTDIYVNDAFGASHRAHASIVGMPKVAKQKAIGFLMKKEIEILESILKNPKKPYWAVLGGAKVSDKIGIIENLIDHVDGFVIGGAMAYTFLAAEHRPVGNSLVEKTQVTFARKLIERLKGRNKKLALPIDHVVAPNINAEEKDVKIVKDIEAGLIGFDIGPQTVKHFAESLADAKTIFWNGPMGVFEKPLFSKGTFALAHEIAELDAISIVGGGDSASAARASGESAGFTHISTGGGASLEFLQGLPLPGLLALQGKWKDHMRKSK